MTKYSDIPVPANACRFRIATHTIKVKGEDVRSRSYCRKIVDPGSEFCPRHALVIRQRESDKIAREELKKAERLKESAAKVITSRSFATEGHESD